MVVADASPSTRCGVDGACRSRPAIARAIGTIGMSAVFFQDHVRADHVRRRLRATSRRCGRASARTRSSTVSTPISTSAGARTSGVADSLSDADRGVHPEDVARFRSSPISCSTTRDACSGTGASELDARRVPRRDRQRVRVRDAARLGRVDRGLRRRDRTVARDVARTLRRLARAYAEWQDEVERMAKDADIDVLRLGLDRTRASGRSASSWPSGG